MTDLVNQLAPYQQKAKDVLAALGSDGPRGLSEEEARARLERYGRNELAAEKRVPGWRNLGSVPGCTGDPAIGRHRHLGWIVAV